MSRPLRPDVPGVFHVTQRGNNHCALFADDSDRRIFYSLVERVVERYKLIVHAHVLMTNHVHLILEAPLGGLPLAMRELNGGYACVFNVRHGRINHLFGERYGSVVIRDATQFRNTVRDLALNPAASGLCSRPELWPWGSYRATLGLQPAPGFLNCAFVLDLFRVDGADPRDALAWFVAEALRRRALPRASEDRVESAR